jgi:ABC-type nitrate/sulfonate/bicarbonate transport system permease component
VTDSGFFDALLYSLKNLAVGLALAIVVGIVVGIAVGWFRVLQFTVAPLMWALYATPTVALAPLIILAFGLGDTSKIVLVFVMSVFPIMLNTMEGVQTVSGSLIRAGRVFGASGTALGRKVVLPATFPFLLVGLQRGVALAFIGEILGEFLGGAGGLGHLLERATFDFRMADALAIVVIMVVVVNAGLILLAVLRKRFAPWHDVGVAKV